eukprot:CAMPEP_0177773560 /NCGR_PEP_ID=MMETSP0491_2-20121128/12946_1 /TAXON_ID=63592 /ORGANISM="Tetraselmis chuii, Strain PLY429" /LENGTH=127 /DNA_ID=CAMNT_0019291695 /DNA_START=216 /DNA_END=599 /DNA_ORIENTATION=+
MTQSLGPPAWRLVYVGGVCVVLWKRVHPYVQPVHPQPACRQPHWPSSTLGDQDGSGRAYLSPQCLHLIRRSVSNKRGYMRVRGVAHQTARRHQQRVTAQVFEGPDLRFSSLARREQVLRKRLSVGSG